MERNMADKIQGVIEVRDFKGLFVSADPHDIDTEQATVQKNVMSDNIGKITTRHGWKVCVFEGE